jgi:hypothetical protein
MSHDIHICDLTQFRKLIFYVILIQFYQQQPSVLKMDMSAASGVVLLQAVVSAASGVVLLQVATPRDDGGYPARG